MNKYRIKITNAFKRDLKLARKRNFDLKLLKKIIDKLAAGEILESRYKDHPLTGNFSGFRECHILPDWILIYYIEKDILVLTLSRTGKHCDLL